MTSDRDQRVSDTKPAVTGDGHCRDCYRRGRDCDGRRRALPSRGTRAHPRPTDRTRARALSVPLPLPLSLLPFSLSPSHPPSLASLSLAHTRQVDQLPAEAKLELLTRLQAALQQ